MPYMGARFFQGGGGVNSSFIAFLIDNCSPICSSPTTEVTARLEHFSVTEFVFLRPQRSQEDMPYHFTKGMVCQFKNGTVCPPATSEANKNHNNNKAKLRPTLARTEKNSKITNLSRLSYIRIG
jgi:hypothetical protein